MREEVKNIIDGEVVIKVFKRVQRAKYPSGIIVKGYGTEVARRIISREYEIERLESYINWLKSEKHLIKVLSQRPISIDGQPILSKKLEDKNNEMKRIKKLLDKLKKQKENEGLANIKITVGAELM